MDMGITAVERRLSKVGAVLEGHADPKEARLTGASFLMGKAQARGYCVSAPS